MSNEKLEKVAESFGEYFVPQFIKECAARGIEFKSEEDLAAAIESATLLDQYEKQAQAEDVQQSPIVAANDMLKKAMHVEGTNEGVNLTEKKAAAANIGAALYSAIS